MHKYTRLARCLTTMMVVFLAAMTLGSPLAHAAPQKAATTPATWPALIHISDATVARLITEPEAKKHFLYRDPIPTHRPKNQPPRTFGIQTIDNSIWGGYVPDLDKVLNYLVNEVYTTVTVVTTPQGSTILSGWAGIGGVYGNLIQAGVNDTDLQTWIDFPPSPSLPLINVRRGDVVYIQISLDQSTGDWFVFVEDETTGHSTGDEWSYTPDRNTADFITEVSSNGSVPTFNTMSFSDATYFDNFGNDYALDASLANPLWKITLKSPNSGCVVPSAIVSHYNFSTSRANSCS